MNLGPDPEGIFELIKITISRDTLWEARNGSTSTACGRAGVKIDIKEPVAGWGRSHDLRQAGEELLGQPIDWRFPQPALDTSGSEPASWPRTMISTRSSPATVRGRQEQDLLYEIVPHRVLTTPSQNNCKTLQNGRRKP